jgi:hypothetical protein
MKVKLMGMAMGGWGLGGDDVGLGGCAHHAVGMLHVQQLGLGWLEGIEQPSGSSMA